MKNRNTLMTTATLSLTLIAALSFSGVSLAITEHCPNHQNEPDKVQSGSAGNNLILPAGTMLCVKAGPSATSILRADGTTTLKQYVQDAGIRVGNGNVPDVSYYVVYGQEGTPSPTPTGSPEPTPTPSQSIPTTTPSPTTVPTPSESPESPDPTPTPTPTNSPVIVPTSTPGGLPDTAMGGS